MSRDISSASQMNLWGKQSDSGFGLEPQRNDLYMVDFNSAQKGVAVATKLPLAAILPQYVRSIALPEIRTKAEPTRRDSIPYNMPSWDDPLDAIKITFLLDTHAQDDRSDVIQFLDAWLALTRAGRGCRFDGYRPQLGYLLLNTDYGIDFAYNVNVYLLRGANATGVGYVDNSNDTAQFDEFIARSNNAYQNKRAQDGLVQEGRADDLPPPVPPEENLLYTPPFNGTFQNLALHSTYVLRNAWLAAYKLSDLNYTESALVTVDATFYADAIELATTPPIAHDEPWVRSVTLGPIPGRNFGVGQATNDISTPDDSFADDSTPPNQGGLD